MKYFKECHDREWCRDYFIWDDPERLSDEVTYEQTLNGRRKYQMQQTCAWYFQAAGKVSPCGWRVMRHSQRVLSSPVCHLLLLPRSQKSHSLWMGVGGAPGREQLQGQQQSWGSGEGSTHPDGWSNGGEVCTQHHGALRMHMALECLHQGEAPILLPYSFQPWPSSALRRERRVTSALSPGPNLR